MWRVTLGTLVLCHRLEVGAPPTGLRDWWGPLLLSGPKASKIPDHSDPDSESGHAQQGHRPIPVGAPVSATSPELVPKLPVSPPELPEPPLPAEPPLPGESSPRVAGPTEGVGLPLGVGVGVGVGLGVGIGVGLGLGVAHCCVPLAVPMTAPRLEMDTL